MKLCFMCDLHLPFDKNALQYDVLNWAMADIGRKKPDCVLFAGDVTCDGNAAVYNWFLEKMQGLSIPFLYIPGNSDLRCESSRENICRLASPIETKLDEITVFAVNDCKAEVSDDQLLALEKADKNSIVFMHHPIAALQSASQEKMQQWRETHKDIRLFFGHSHQSAVNGSDISLQALDPDKAIGECPCITYFDTETNDLRKAYYYTFVPWDSYSYMGISCYDASTHIQYAIENGLQYLELRPNCLNTEASLLLSLVTKWRANGGKNLSIHLPDVRYIDGAVEDNHLDRYVALSNLLKADRFTQHVPVVSVAAVKTDPYVLEQIAKYLTEKWEKLDHEMVIGVENMHMTAAEKPDDTRRFGYTPEECIALMKLLSQYTNQKVGINFDIGHARNNAPFSQTYQISTWLSLIGNYAVGYHIHQVTNTDGKFHNHMPITDINGCLINFGSFFKCWSTGRIQKAPIIFEMDSPDAYPTTLCTFRTQKEQKLFDLHTHTYYSFCGKDDPRDLVEKVIEHGITLLGICDHNYGIGSRKQTYLQEIRALAKDYANILPILCGIEIATIPSLYDIKDVAEIKDYDYCLIEHITDPKSLVGGDLFEFCKKLGILCGIAHTDLFAYCDMYGYDYTEFFSQMAENNIFWELNVSYDSIHKFHEHEYVAEFMNDSKKREIIKTTGVRISIGSDCHRQEEYSGSLLEQIYRFLKSNGINTVDTLFQ